MGEPDADVPDPTFRGALRVREYRLLWLAGAQSSAGDQLARIAIVLLVYAARARRRSARPPMR